MNHETTIKRIQELVPSVMELSFGCEVIALDDCDVDWNMRVGDTDVIDKNNQIKFGNAWFDIKEILGKPITLAVVLLAIIKNDGLPATFSEAEKGEIGNDWSDMMFRFRDMNWNLSKDNFNDQSEETKTFIGGLLGN